MSISDEFGLFANQHSADDKYAKVLATPRVCAFMEIVSARMLVPHLKPGQMSVGTRIDLQHLAATPVNETVTVCKLIVNRLI